MLVNEQARIELIEAARRAEEEKPAPERREIPWRQSSERLVVVEIPLDVVLLNPNSHRIQAQLQSLDRYDEIRADPFTAEAQQIIAGLLREPADAFEELKADLKESGQREPGVITREGVLVNANRRAVALRDLGKDYIRVMVLPRDATAQDINELELRLQIKKELKEDYTYTNTLLFIKDCLSNGWSHGKVARELGYGTDDRAIAKVKQAERTLALIDEIRDQSGRRYRYSDFDSAQQALEELDRRYEDLKRVDPAGAQRLRAARLAGLLIGVGYRELRAVDVDFGREYLEDAIRDDDALKPLADELIDWTDSTGSVDGVDEVFGPGPGGLRADPAVSLYNWLIDTASSREVEIRKSGVKLDRREVVEDIRRAFIDAASNAEADRQRGSAIEAPRNRVREARKKVEAARAALTKARADSAFTLQHLKSLEADTNKLLRATNDLRSEIAGAIDAMTGEATPEKP